jgi:hypothetical protein
VQGIEQNKPSVIRCEARGQARDFGHGLPLGTAA